MRKHDVNSINLKIDEVVLGFNESLFYLVRVRTRNATKMVGQPSAIWTGDYSIICQRSYLVGLPSCRLR